MMKYDVLTCRSSSSASDFSAGAGESFNDDEDTIGDFTQLLVSDDNPCQESTCYTCIGTRTHLFLTIFAMIVLATTYTMSTHQQRNNRDGVQGAILPTADQSPHIAWLMSFPNSGTSYTLRLVQTSGPYLRQQTANELPKTYILTKTHCGGRCVHCIPGEG